MVDGRDGGRNAIFLSPPQDPIYSVCEALNMRRCSCWSLLFLLGSTSSFSLGPSAEVSNWNRREVLAKFITVPAAASTLTSSPRVAKAVSNVEGNVCTVVVDSPDSSNVGIQFVDTTINGKVYATIDKVEPDSIAAKSGARSEMVLLARESATKSSSKNIEFRLRNGPYPFILQFATPDTLEKITSSNTVPEANERALGPYDRIDVKTVKQSSNCNNKAKSGDTLSIAYEARISSATGLVYDSTSWRQGDPATFQLGKGETLPGVEIGLNGMCVGEVREIDVPASLGYGKFGSQVFDIPGDVRLFWRVELLDLTKGKRQLRII